ncbi:MAG: type II toxin-antitoxin system PemK/MazF family toxin [Gammaproteobacteria bacterium]|nr:MAG: type II toxin-antitoxin system PemK/MazF family toxin [Gammaproteobacteria bacterium]
MKQTQDITYKSSFTVSGMGSTSVVRRGEVWWASLPTPQGSSPGYRRPILIVQSDEFNRSRINTVVAVVITSKLILFDAPGNVRLPVRASGLKKISVVNVSQVITVDKSYLTERVGILKGNHMKEVDDGLRLVLAV